MSPLPPMSARRKRRLWAAALVTSGAALLIAGLFDLKDYVRALTLLGAVRPSFTGRFVVGTSTINLAVGPNGSNVPVGLYYPAIETTEIGGRLAAVADMLAHPNRSRTQPSAPLAVSQAPLKLILYFPSWFSERNENSFTLANLASQGFIVASLDDVVHLAPMNGDDRIAQEAGLDFSSEEAFNATRVLAGRRTVLEARLGSAILDRIAGSKSWGRLIDANHVGALGFSFGGSVAATMSRSDPRVRAIVNLDGWLFGEVAESGVDIPNLTLWSDEPFPTEQDLSQPDLAGRLEAILNQSTVEQQRRHDTRPDSWTFLVEGTKHEDFSDRLLNPAIADHRSARGFDQVRAWSEINGAIFGFLNASLRGRSNWIPPYPPGTHAIETLEAASQHAATLNIRTADQLTYERATLKAAHADNPIAP